MLEAADYKDKSGEDFRQMMADEQVMMMMAMVMMIMGYPAYSHWSYSHLVGI